MGQFKLEKWYLDAVDSRGQAFIGYAATIHWKSIKLGYSGYTFLNTNNRVSTHNSFSPISLPQIRSALITSIQKKYSGTWQQVDPGYEEVLLQDGEKHIHWNCIQPKAIANIQINEDQMQQARGYAERIDLTFLPWKIPIHELYWGRFLSDSHTVVWIKWIGPIEKNMVYVNGKKIDDATIRADGISFERYQLFFSDAISLRKGNLHSTVFARFKELTKLFPRSIMNLMENKWLSKGTLYADASLISSGNVIHEVVQWK